MAVFTVLGAGMMGSALCVPLCDRGHEVRLVGTHLDGAIIEQMRSRHHHPKLRYDLPTSIAAFEHSELENAMEGCDVLVLGVSSAGIAWAAERIAPFASRGLPLFGITKGLDFDGQQLRVLPDVVRDAAGWPNEPAAVAGPCIAGELARRVPSCVVLTGRDGAMLERIAGLIGTDYYHLQRSTDVVGAEACAALKNAYAMGVAFGAGLHAKAGGQAGSVAMHNYESAVFAQALWEMARVVQAMGGSIESVVGLAGAGDLDVTNNGGRTGRFGRFLGMGLSLADAIEAMEGATLECLGILAVMRAATRDMQRQGKLPELPLLEHMAAVALDGAPVQMPFERFFGSGA